MYTSTMKKELLQLNHNYQNILSYALFDKNISNTAFRLLNYIALTCDKYDILNIDIKNEIGIKCNNTIANCFKVLIENLYISRQIKKSINKKNISTYVYSINTLKPLFPKNRNYNLITRSSLELELINDVFNYFFQKIPATSSVDISKNLKSINHLINIDGYSKKDLLFIIDYVSKSDLKFTITRPLLLRNFLKTHNLKDIKKHDFGIFKNVSPINKNKGLENEKG